MLYSARPCYTALHHWIPRPALALTVTSLPLTLTVTLPLLSRSPCPSPCPSPSPYPHPYPCPTLPYRTMQYHTILIPARPGVFTLVYHHRGPQPYNARSYIFQDAKPSVPNASPPTCHLILHFCCSWGSKYIGNPDWLSRSGPYITLNSGPKP